MSGRIRGRDLRPLRRAGLADALTPSQLEALAADTDVVRVDAGMTLARRGSVAREFLALIDGEVEVIGPDDGVRRAGPGLHVGAAELLDRTPHAATVVTASECTLVVVLGRAYNAVFRWGLGEKTSGRA
jgi:CRP-like cAMP-binding protein